MAKYKVHVNGNAIAANPQVQTSANQIMQQMAQNTANQQLQAQAENNEDATRETLNELVKKSLLNPVEVPRYTTIQDVLNASKGEKLTAFTKFLDNPETMRTLGDFMPYYGYDPKTGEGNNVMDAPARRQEALMKAEQAKALEQQKQQNAVLNNVYDAYNRMDIANENNKRMRELAEMQNEWQKERFAQEMALRQQQLNAQIQHQRAMEGIARDSLGSGGGSATGGAASIDGNDLSNVKMTAADRKSLTENKTTLANIEAGLKSLDDNPNAYSFLKGVLGSDITNRIDPKGVATRTQIDNITAVYRKWLTGAQMSDKERKAYERFLPAPTDNYNIVKSKLEGMRGAVQRSNEALLSNYGISQNANSDPLGLGF